MAFAYDPQMLSEPPEAQGYTPEQFQQWYQQQYKSAATPEFMNQLGTTVGAPTGPGGLYSQQQWQQGQDLAGKQPPGAQPPPFFSEFTPPTYEAGPAYQAPAAFQAPSYEQAQNDPGYQFSLKQGMGALQANQAARGISKTGGAMKGLIDYGQQAASQQYDKAYSRAAGQYAQNYQQGRDTWATNQSQRENAYDRQYKGATDAFNSKFRGQELSFEDLFRRWNTNVNVQAQQALAQ